MKDATQYWEEMWEFYRGAVPALAKKVRTASTDEEGAQIIRDYLAARPYSSEGLVASHNRLEILEKIRQKLSILNIGEPPTFK